MNNKTSHAIEKTGKTFGADLKLDYYSLNESERHRALEKLADLNTVEASRELIQIFYSSQWRETKLFIIKSIVRCSNQRTLEFLIDQIPQSTLQITSHSNDIPMAEQAINSLGAIENELARKFLMQLYKNGPEQLKPSVVLALAEAHNRNLVLQFVTDLTESYRCQKHYLSKNLIYAVGELKCKEALLLLADIIRQTDYKDLALSALMALGKITRDLNDITQFEKKFIDDTFEYQIYRNVKNQVMLRANWKVEDYLQKIFEDKSYHAAMPLELNTFSEGDVKAGLELFVAPDKQKPLFDILSKLSFKNTPAWYNEFLDGFANINFDLFKNSLTYQHADSYVELVNSKKDIRNEQWLYLAICCLPSADKIFADIFESEDYKSLSASEKIGVINQYSNLGFIYKFDNKKLSQFEKRMESLLLNEADFAVQARIIRSFAQASINNSKVNLFIKQNLFKKEFVASCLFYFERSPSAFAIEQLESYVLNELVSANFCVQLIKALGVQHPQVLKNKTVENYILHLAQVATQDNKSPSLHKNLTLLLSKLPFPSLRNFVIQSLKWSEIEIQLNAVIAIKSYRDESAADDVAKLLSSGVDAVRGRALDSLLSTPGLRSKRLVFDYFISQIDKQEVVEQVCRRFELPEKSSDYFYNQLRDILKKKPDHRQINLLNEFKENLFVALQTDKLMHNEKPDTEVINIDLELSKKIAGYNQYDEPARSALRSAELPFVHPEMYTSFVDKSTSILGYCKALDIILEKQLGRKILIPKLEIRLHEFQNHIHLYELNDSNPSFDRVIKNLALEKHFNQQSLPLHKMSLIGQGILNSKIINEQFKILDGLRAWAVVLLLFSRKTVLVQKPLIQICDDESLVVHLCKKLMWLQELRNPVAHRQTLSDFKVVEQARTEVVEILNSLNKLLKSDKK